MPEAGGLNFERQFAKWMTSRLGFQTTRLRQPVKGRISKRSYEVDVHGERYSKNWQLAERAGPPLFGLAIAMWWFPTQFGALKQMLDGVVSAFHQGLVEFSLGLLGVGGLALGHLGKQKSTTHVWIECKDTKTNVKRAQVQKLWASVEDVLKSNDMDWKPAEVLIAARGFDADALTFAEEYGFSCYEQTETGFKCVLKGERITPTEADDDE